MPDHFNEFTEFNHNVHVPTSGRCPELCALLAQPKVHVHWQCFSHPPRAVVGAVDGQHAVQAGAQQRAGDATRQHRRAEGLPPARLTCHRAH